jgi:galactose oxidase
MVLLVATVVQAPGGGGAPAAPSPVLAATAKSTWTATADSQELVGENGAAQNALDGSATTIWHTAWYNGNAPLPHWITIDTKAVQPWAGLVYTPRPATTGRNGNIGQFQIDVSSDGTTWSPAPVAQGTWPDSSAKQTATFPSVMARYVRLKALTESANRGPWSDAAELDLLVGAAPTGTPTATSSPTSSPSPDPTLDPGVKPSSTPKPTVSPTVSPTAAPPSPTASPTASPTSSPAPPGLPPRSSWVATADSQETAGENGAAANVLDGDPATIWHTGWSSGNAPLPHWIVLDTLASRSVTALSVTARPLSTGPNGRIGQYRVEISGNGTAWTTAATGTLLDSGGTQTISFAAAVGRYVRLTALTEAGNRGPWTSAAEIDLTSAPAPGTPTPTPTPTVTQPASPTPSPTLSPTPSPTPSPTLLATPAPTLTPTPTPTTTPTTAPPPTLAPRSQWTATADSQETVGENGAVANVLDGDPATIWHTGWSSGNAPLPHWVVLDTKTARSITAVAVTARPLSTGPNGRIGQYRVEVSSDGTAWITTATGTLGDYGGTQTIAFPAVVGRYLRLTALTEAGNRGPWTSAAEIDLTSSLPPVSPTPTPTATPTATATPTPTAATSGLWSARITLPIDPAAAALLGNGKVLTWSSYAGDTYGGANGFTQTATIDTTTGAVSQRTVTETGHDMFCPGLALLGDGAVFVAGGSNSEKQSTFDPGSGTWSSAAPLQVPRGYQSTVTLSNSKVFTVGGSWNGGTGNKTAELWTPGVGGGTSTLLPGIPATPFETNDAQGEFRSDNHMWLFAWSGGTVFQAGPSKAMHWMDTSGSGSWSTAGLRGDDGDAMNGNAVMYDAGRILTVGGAPDYQNSPATSNAYIVDIRGSAPTVTKLPSMANPRAFANSVVLPDGKVLVVGGQQYAVPFSDATSVLTPELWDPVTKAFTPMAPMTVPRNYHSFALLLPDGRVLAGGGQLCANGCAQHPDYEIFTPPNLLDSAGNPRPRPSLVSAPSSATAGSTVSVSTDKPVAGFSLVRMGSATHSVDTDQRRVTLTATSTGATTYDVTLPSDRGVLVPGEWMLFALDAAGVPSVARTVLVH